MTKIKYQSGYMAVLLLVFVAVSVVIASAAMAMSIATLQSVSVYTQGNEALSIAQSGAENALIRLLRDPTYTNETLTVGAGTATITVTGTTPQTITVIGAVGTKKRKIQLTVTRTSGILSVTSWAEVYN